MRKNETSILISAVWSKNSLDHLAIQRIFCMACGLIRQRKVGFDDPCRSNMKVFERHALDVMPPYGEATTALQSRVLKSSRWLLLKSPQNLDDYLYEHQRFKEFLELIQHLAINVKVLIRFRFCIPLS